MLTHLIQKFILESIPTKLSLVKEEMVVPEVDRMEETDNVHYVVKEHLLF